MKKLLCLFALFMVLCTAHTQVYANSALTEAIEYLSAVGIDFEYDEETIQPEQRVTRAVFAQDVTKLINMSERKCNNVYYHDVSADHWAFDNIGVLTELGIINGSGNKYFRPDEYISRNEAATILVSVLGYRVYAEDAGGYPDGYIKMASELQIFKNCSSNADLTLSDALIMLRNVLDEDVMYTFVSGNETKYTKSDDETILSYYHKKYYAKGTLTGCDEISLSSANRIPDDTAIIDGYEYTTKLTGLLDNIGTQIEFLYETDDKDSSERELIWVRSLDRNEVLDVQKDEYCSFDSNRYVFSYVPEGSEREKNISISRGIIVIYNGAITKESVENILNSDKYRVRFIKSQRSSLYDIAIVQKYENIVVGKVDSYEQVIYDKFDFGRTLDISDKRDKIVVDNNMTLDQIEVGDVLSFYESEDGEYLKIKISKSTAEVTALYVTGNEEKILVSDSGEFVFYDSKTSIDVLNGETVKLYFDINGFIAYVEKVKTGGFPAYLIKAIYDDSEELLTLKTLDYDGSIVTRQVAEKGRLDGITKKHIDIFSSLTVDRKTVSQVVILKINDNNQIKSIDTVEVGNEKQNLSLRCLEKNYTGRYKHHGRLVPKVLVSPDTTIFSVPSAASGDDRDYLVKGKSDLKNDQFYTVDIYRYSENDTGYEEILVIKDKTWSISTDKTYVLVGKISDVLNSDGETVEKLECNWDGNTQEYITTYDFSLSDNGIKPGDLIELSINMRDEIEDAEIRYSYGSETRPINTAYNAEPGLRIVYVHEKVGNVLKIGHSSGDDFDEIFEIPEDRIVIYDNNEIQKIRKGTMWDILPYMTVAIQTIDETPYSVVIYK